MNFPKTLYYRRRVLLAILARGKDRMEKIRLQKLLFLFTQYQEKPVYHFLPYKYGCYSFQAAEDARILTDYYQLLTTTKNDKAYAVSNKKIKEMINLKPRDEDCIDAIFDEYGRLSKDALIYEVYKKYPYYAINSKFLDKPKFKPLRHRITKAKPQIKDKRLTLYTIGYEGKSVEQYIRDLIDNGISALIDVRHNPFSMKWGFSKKQLQNITDRFGMAYIHIPELGIKGNLRKNIKSRTEYNRLFNEYRKTLSQTDKKQALQDLVKIVRQYRRVAITCFEQEHTCCHRNDVAKAIADKHKIIIQHL